MEEPETKIIDLNDDCLKKIFGYLNLHHLFNVAIANQYLRPAAADIYKRKFGMMPVRICNCDDYRRGTRALRHFGHDTSPESSVGFGKYNEIFVSGLKTNLLYLRCFGKSIRDLKVYGDMSDSERFIYLQLYIDEFCGDDVVVLSLDCVPHIQFNQFKKNFKKVETFHGSSIDFGEQWPSFTERFSNVKNLSLQHASMDETQTPVIMKSHLPRLKTLDLNSIRAGGIYVTLLMGSSLTKNAPQLETLTITAGFQAETPLEVDLLMNMIATNPLL